MDNKNSAKHVKNYMKVGAINSKLEKELNNSNITSFTSTNSFYYIVDAKKSNFKHYNIEPSDPKVKIL